MSPSVCSSVSRLCNSSRPVLTLDDLFFRLYYRFTSVLLLLASVLTLLREWSVDSIDCSVPSSALPASTVVGSEVAHYRINTYCKLANQFISVTPLNQSCGHLPLNISAVSADNVWLQLPKYQWFAWIFFVASLALYLPHLLWKCCNQTMVKLVTTVRFARRSKSQFRFGSPDQRIKSHLQATSFSHLHLFTFFYLLSKLFNFVLLTGFVYLLNHLLFGQFIYFPIAFFDKLQVTSKTTLVDQATQTANCTVSAADLSDNKYTDIFPKSSLCPYTYHDQVAKRSQTILVNCLMPINSLLEQILLFIWFWLALVIIFTLFDFCRYLLLICCRPIRIFCLQYSTNSALAPATYQLCSTNFSTWLFSTIILLSNQHYGQWSQKPSHRSLEVIDEDDEADNGADVLYETVELKDVRRNTRRMDA